MFELVFLGTSASAPGIYRGLPAQMVLAGEYRFLIDCGEGTQRQILQSGLGFKKLNHIFLTHAHLDHILGLGGLLSTLTRWETLEEIHVWGGQFTLERVKSLIFNVVFPNQSPPIPLIFHAVTAGQLFEDKKFTIRAIDVRHQGPGNFGYVFEEKSRRPFLPEKAAALNIPVGPIRGQLVAGKTVTLPDGRVILPDEVLGDEIRGIKYVHIGDCGYTGNLLEATAGADCLVIEATYADSERDMAKHFGHMTAGDAARFAREAGVKTLILTHISRRNREHEIRHEAQAIFPNSIVARDFDHYQMTRDSGVQKIETQPETEVEEL